MSVCKDCAFWHREDCRKRGKTVGYIFGLGECTAAKMLWDVAIWDDDGKIGFTKEGENTNVFLQDGSDYKATMATRPDFGCVSWKAKT